MHPQLDDKILTDWNGLMISALLRCARGLDDSSYLKLLRKRLTFVAYQRSPNGNFSKDGDREKQVYLLTLKIMHFSFKD